MFISQPVAQQWIRDYHLPRLSPLTQEPFPTVAELAGTAEQFDAAVQQTLFQACIKHLSHGHACTITGLRLSEPGAHLLVANTTDNIPFMGINGFYSGANPEPGSFTIPGKSLTVPVAGLAFSEEAEQFSMDLQSRYNGEELPGPEEFIVTELLARNPIYGEGIAKLSNRAYIQSTHRAPFWGSSESALKFLMTAAGVIK